MTSLSELIQRYDRPGPRYTGYPMPPVWQADFPEHEIVRALGRANARPEPLSLYAHLPFCSRRCAYCGCNVVISPKYDPVGAFLATLDREAELWASHLPDRRGVIQMHWGGGTPNFLSPDQIQRLIGILHEGFDFLPGFEFSVELAPSHLKQEQIDALLAPGGTVATVLSGARGKGVQALTQCEEARKAIARLKSESDTAMAAEIEKLEVQLNSVKTDVVAVTLGACQPVPPPKAYPAPTTTTTTTTVPSAPAPGTQGAGALGTVVVVVVVVGAGYALSLIHISEPTRPY